MCTLVLSCFEASGEEYKSERDAFFAFIFGQAYCEVVGGGIQCQQARALNRQKRFILEIQVAIV